MILSPASRKDKRLFTMSVFFSSTVCATGVVMVASSACTCGTEKISSLPSGNISSQKANNHNILFTRRFDMERAK